jgi:hypothetical protein
MTGLRGHAIEIVKRVNQAFSVEAQKPQDAHILFGNIITILTLIGERHPEEFKRTLVNFNCVDYDPENKQGVSNEFDELYDLRREVNRYAVVQTNTYFKRNWKAVCDKFTADGLTRCRKKGLDCIKILYNFFCDCSGIYETNYNYLLHNKFCKKCNIHPENVKTVAECLYVREESTLFLATKSHETTPKRTIVVYGD